MDITRLAPPTTLHGTNALSEVAASVRKQATEQLTSHVESTRVELSALGRQKAALSVVDNAARILEENKRHESAGQVHKAVQRLVDAANKQREIVAESPRLTGQSAVRDGASTPRLQATSTEIQRALQSADNGQALKTVGVTVADNGALAVDAQVLTENFQNNPPAVTQAASRLGREVADITSRLLADKGPVNTAINRLTERLNTLEQQQVADDRTQQARTQEIRRTVQETDQRQNEAQRLSEQGFNFNGVNAYKDISAF